MGTYTHVPPPYTQAQFNALLDDFSNWQNGFTPSGTFSSPYRYLITKDATPDYYASNAYQTVFGGPSDAGGVDGANPGAVIAAAIGDLTAGRDWKEKVVIRCDCDLDLTNVTGVKVGISVPSYTILQVIGKLSVPNAANTNVGKSNFVIRTQTNAHDIDLIGGEIDGNMAGQDPGNEIYGIATNSAYNILVRDWYVHDTKETAIAFEGTSYRCWAVNNMVRNTDEDGLGNQYPCHDIFYIGNYADVGAGGQNGNLYIEGGLNIVAIGNILLGETDLTPNGIKVTRGTSDAPISVSLIGNKIAHCTYGINTANYMTNLLIQGNNVYENDADGIICNGTNSKNINITGNIVYNNNQSNGAHSGISISGPTYCSVIGNKCYDDQAIKTQDYGVAEAAASGSDYNLFKSNDCRGNNLAPYRFVGTNNTYDGKFRTAVPADLSAAGSVLVIGQSEDALYIPRAAVIYTEASSADAGSGMKIGKANAAAVNNLYYYNGLSASNQPIWTNTQLTLSNKDHTAGDTIIFTNSGGKTGAGEVMIIVDYCTGA